MKPNAYCSFDLPNYDVLKDCEYVSNPRSDLLVVTCNPFTGRVSLAYQRSTNSLAWLDYIAECYRLFCNDFQRTHKRPARFRDFIDACEGVE